MPHHRSVFLLRAVKVAVIGMSLALTVRVGWALEPDVSPPKEVTGSLPPSIHVPPVRERPPARTHFIDRPRQYDPETTARKQTLRYRLESLRLAIEDLMETYGRRYPDGEEFLSRWRAVSKACREKASSAESRFTRLRDEALLANPLLDMDRLLVLKRKRGQLGLPTNHQCNTSLNQTGYDNELAVLSPVDPGGELSTLFRPPEGYYVGEMDLRFDAQRLLFTMPNGRTWQIHEIGLDGEGLRQVSREVPDVDNFDPCYLPNGRIVFSSTAAFTGVPCWHGKERACCLYSMASDGAQVRQLCHDQDLDLHPSVLDNGQVIFSRWDYTGILHAYLRPLMAMNPDGSGQRAVYGSNSYYPNCLFFPRGVPGQPNKVVAVLAGYHGRNRMGELAVLDIGAGWSGPEGIIHRITHRDEPIVPVARDRLTQHAKHQFLHPYPLSDKYILTAMQTGKQSWGIYLVDVFDNIVPILTDPDFDFFEPIPVARRPAPPRIPSRVDASRDDAVAVIHDVYKGEGLKGVPRGTIKRLRIVGYHFGYPGMAGPDKIGRAGPWEVMRIIGTVPVYEDGSAKFRLPANVPVSLQALDAEGKAVQLMRSWYTAMPGETASCVGCHETPRDTPASRVDIAATRPVSDIESWYGPPRGFDFAREVQPVLDEHCVSCHQGKKSVGGKETIDLRGASLVENYEGLPLTRLGARRLDAVLREQHGNRFQPCNGMPHPYGSLKTRYTPAYEALIPFVRRPNIEDAAGLPRPGEYHADTSELVQLLRKGHYGVRLDAEAWDRLVTWIDLNAPCHGTWNEVAPVPREADKRRRELVRATSGPPVDPENVVQGERYAPTDVAAATAPVPMPGARRSRVQELLDAHPEVEDPTVQKGTGETMTLDLGNGLDIELVRIPSGGFLMGDTTGKGDADEWPPQVVHIRQSFWMGRTEITNAQMREIMPEHHSGFFTKRQIDEDGPGIQLNSDDQPAVRVSWNDAMEFCRRLSKKVDGKVTLPTEAQWEYAARAGTLTELSHGDCTTDFSRHANMADRSLACLYEGTAGVALLQPIPSVLKVDDLAIATAEVASYRPNAWGLYDMHGNAAEWTRSPYRPYPYREAGVGKDSSGSLHGKDRVARGGSFYDRPRRCRSSHRRHYPAWQAVHDAGFRIVVPDDEQ
ncbi:MAG: SUMF1/EgtB/PvdO family nonheme iron enzyme [Planctomycetota bacterium]